MPIAGDPNQSAIILLAGGKSAAIDVSGGISLGLIFPAAFDAVPVTFEGSVDGVTFAAISMAQSGAGAITLAALSLPSPLASKAVSLPWELSPFNFIKLVAAVTADRTVLVSSGG